MNKHADQSRFLPLLIVGIAVILSSTAGIAAIMGWLPASTDGSSGILVPDDLPVASAKPIEVTARTASGQLAREARVKGKCAECGVIMSVREIEARDEGAGLDGSDWAAAGNQDELRVATASRYEITIRMSDRSTRVINHESPVVWQPGEHMILIDGANRTNR